MKDLTLGQSTGHTYCFTHADQMVVLLEWDAESMCVFHPLIAFKIIPLTLVFNNFTNVFRAFLPSPPQSLA